jgi:hypothetical protein
VVHGASHQRALSTAPRTIVGAVAMGWGAARPQGSSGKSAFLSVRSTKLDLLCRMPLIL